MGQFDIEDENVNMRIQLEIEKAVQKAEQEGLQVSLTDQEKEQLSRKMKETIRQLQGELEENGSIRCLDVFGIGTDEKVEQALAQAVMQIVEPDPEDGEQISAGNINTAAMYEAGAVVHFVQKGGRVESVVNPAFEVKPILLIWDPVLQEITQYEISDEVMTKQNLTMKLRIPAASAKGQKNLVINQYDNYVDFNLINRYEAPVQEKDGSCFAEISVNLCSPFELVQGNSTAPASGTAGSNTWLYLGLALAFVSAAAVLAVSLRRKKNAGGGRS